MNNKSLTKVERDTISTYNAMAEEWAKTHDTRGFWGPYLNLFRGFLPKGRILEVGCGAGRDGQDLVELGYDWTGTDPSEGMLAVARTVHDPKKLFGCSVYDLSEVPGAPFDGFWAAASLLHVPKNRVREALRSIHGVVRPGGIGFISVKRGEGSGVVALDAKERSYTPGSIRHFFYYEPGELEEHLIKTGFSLLHAGSHTVGSRTSWLITIVQRNP